MRKTKETMRKEARELISAEEIFILKTGKDVIDNNVVQFHVNNGNWDGVVSREDGRVKITAGQKTNGGFKAVNSFFINEDSDLDWCVGNVKVNASPIG